MSNENLTEKTLADVQAGIPARDAEIETLRKENAELREQLEAVGAGGVSGKLMPGAAPVSAEPDYQMCRQAYDDFYHKIRAEIGYDHWCSIWRFIAKRLSAPVSAQAQPDWRLIQKGDQRIINGQVMTCTDPEIGRWQGSGPQQPVSGADGLKDAAIENLAQQYECHTAPGFKGFARAIEHLVQLSGNPGQLAHLPDATKMVPGDQFRDAAQMIEPSGNSGGLPVSVRDALDWYAQQVGNCRRFGPAGDAARADLDADGGRRARAALAQQDDETGKSVLVGNQGVVIMTDFVGKSNKEPDQ